MAKRQRPPSLLRNPLAHPNKYKQVKLCSPRNAASAMDATPGVAKAGPT